MAPPSSKTYLKALDMTTIGLPYVFEDTTGLVSGPTDFIDIYGRPPFLRVESAITRWGQPSRTDLAIFDLGSCAVSRSKRRHAVSPSALISFQGKDLRGSIRFQTGLVMQLDRWLKKSTTFGSTLTRQFKASDGRIYQWSFRSVREHEWVCVQLGTNYVVAHYDLKPDEERSSRTSGNMLTVYDNFIYISVELLASLVVMRHLHADVSRD